MQHFHWLHNLSTQKYKFFHGLLLLLLCLQSLPAAASVQHNQSKLQQYLATLAQQEPDERVRVIVQLTGTDAAEQLITNMGGHFVRKLPLINAVVAEMPARALPILAQAPTVRHITLDAPVVKMSEAGDGLITVRDNFDQSAYANNDGEALWAGDWREVGENDGPQTGDIAITPFWGGALQGLRLQGADRGVQRQVDLRQATSATLTLSYRRKDFSTDTDAVVVAISTDSGASWQEVARLNGPATDAEIQYGHYDLQAFTGSTVTLQVIVAATTDPAAKFYLDAVNLQWMPTADATIARLQRIYLPLVVGQNASTVTYSEDEASVQAAVYNTSAL